MTPFDAVDGGCQWIANARYDDIDAQAAQLQGYGQRYEQLGRGRFEGRMVSFTLRDDVSLHVERTNLALMQTGCAPPDRYSALFLLEDSAPGSVNGAAFSRDQIAVWPPGHCFEALTPTGMAVCVISLASRFVSPPGRARIGARIVKDARAAARVREFIGSGLGQIQRDACVLQHPAATADFAAALGELLPFETQTEEARGSAERLSSARGMRLFRVARDKIHRGLAEGVSLTEVCAEVGLHRRSLEKLFYSMLGISPARYIRALQLNSIRRSLRAQENAAASIGDIAARFGIWHWSRFSRDYQMMFGELPSRTRRSPGNTSPLSG